MAHLAPESHSTAAQTTPLSALSALASSTSLSYISQPAYQSLVSLARHASLSLFSRLDSAEAHGLLEIIEEGSGRQAASGSASTSRLYGDPSSKRTYRRYAGSSSAWSAATQAPSTAFAEPIDIINAKKAIHVQANQLKHITHATIRVKEPYFWLRLVLGNDLGFAESYMLGEIETADLGSCFKLFIENRDVLSNLSVGLVSRTSSYIQSLLNRRYANTKTGSLRNIGAHYDISNTMYEAFLSKDMTYSCAVFPSLDADYSGPLLQAVNQDLLDKAASATNGHSHSNGSQRGIAPPLRYESSVAAAAASSTSATAAAPPLTNGMTNGTHGTHNGFTSPDARQGQHTPLLLSNDELEDGQLRKLKIHIDRANLKSSHRVLEIGTGWGSFAIEAVRSSGCHVDSLTLSVEQKALAEQRIAAAGLSNNIKVHLMDYRDMPAKWTDYFDRVVSIEMLEAVGIEFLSTYFACVHRVLKRDGGVCVIQCITIPEERFDTYISTVDFIKKWIFPGGVLPSVTSIMDNVQKGSQGAMILENVHSIGPHYSRTLREWRRRFEDQFDAVIAPALLEDHEEIRRLPAKEQTRQVEIFKRKWLYYFIYCEVGFTERVIGDHILTFSRSGNKTYPVCCA